MGESVRRISDRLMALARQQTAGRHALQLGDDEANELQKCVRDLTDNCQGRFSQSYVQRRLLEAYHSADGEAGEKALAREAAAIVSDAAAYDRKHAVWVPLVGVAVGDAPLRLGPLEVRTFSDEDAGRMRAAMSRSWPPEEGPDPDALEQWSSLLEGRAGQPCAYAEVTAEPVRAREVVQEWLGTVTDALQYAAWRLCPLWQRTTVGMAGSVAGEVLVIPAEHSRGVDLWAERVGPLAPLKLTSETRVRLDELGVPRLAELALLDRRLTGFEQALGRSLHWAARGYRETDHADRLVSFVFALEALLTTSGEGLRATVSEALAIILGVDLESRRGVCGRAKKAYDARSAVAHGRSTNVAGGDDLVEWLGDAVAALIGWATTKLDEFTTLEDLRKWVLARKLSCPGDVTVGESAD